MKSLDASTGKTGMIGHLTSFKKFKVRKIISIKDNQPQQQHLSLRLMHDILVDIVIVTDQRSHWLTCSPLAPSLPSIEVNKNKI